MTTPYNTPPPATPQYPGPPPAWPTAEPPSGPVAGQPSTGPQSQVWAAAKQDRTGVVCPSGQPVKVRRLGMRGLIAAGVLQETDLLTALVDKEHLQRVKGAPSVNAKKLMEDPKAIARALEVVYRIVAFAVVEPELLEPPANEADRLEDKIYADEIEIEDVMFLLNYVMGGSKDLERFRSEFEKSIRDLDPGEASGVSAE